jgi:hypothetical protein
MGRSGGISKDGSKRDGLKPGAILPATAPPRPARPPYAHHDAGRLGQHQPHAGNTITPASRTLQQGPRAAPIKSLRIK